MNNYIILENRPELTTAQVLAGMNFSAIVAGAATASADAFSGKSFGSGFTSKGFLAVLLVVSGVAVYKNYSSYNDNSSANNELSEYDNILIRDKNRGPALMMETIPPKNNKIMNESPDMACRPAGSNREGDNITNHLTYSGPNVPLSNIDSLIALEEAGTFTKSPSQNVQMVQMPQPLTCGKINTLTGNGMTEEPKIYNTTLPFNASPNAKSLLWQPSSFNKNVEVVQGQFKLDCNNCDFNYIPGSKLDNKNYKGVWTHVTRDKRIKFKLETGLKNIYLVRTDGAKCVAVHPIAIGIGGPQWNDKEWTYISNKFKATNATYLFGDHIDFYMIFEDAKVGDKLIIDDFVETLVVE